MATEKNAKIAALAIAAIIIVLAFLGPIPTMGVTSDNTTPAFMPRLLYNILHASVLHAVINAWCLLSAIFIFNIKLEKLLLAFGVAATAPSWVFSEIPTLGLSGVIYFLFGSVSMAVRHKIFYHAWFTVIIAVGFLMPAVNARLHLYCYICGVLLAMLTTPMFKTKTS